jgi:hypothetical protein
LSEEDLKSRVVSEMSRALSREGELDVALSAERGRAVGEEGRLGGLVEEERVRAKGEEDRLEDTKFPRSMGEKPKYTVDVATGNLQIPESAYLMVGSRWRLSANTEYNDNKRFVFEYKVTNDDETSWVVAVPFIAAVGRGGN